MDSPYCCFLRLNLARSNMTFFLTWKNASNLTEAYLFLSSSLILVEARTSAAFFRRQYSSVLTCLTSELLTRSDATGNCSKRFFRFRPIVGLLEIKAVERFQLELCCGHPDTAATMQTCALASLLYSQLQLSQQDRLKLIIITQLNITQDDILLYYLMASYNVAINSNIHHTNNFSGSKVCFPCTKLAKIE